MISFDQAVNTIRETMKPVEGESCPLRSVHRRVLAQDVTAPMDVPPFDNSAMDGYAVRAEDTADARTDRPISLEVSAEIAAGDSSAATLQRGSAFRILTC